MRNISDSRQGVTLAVLAGAVVLAGGGLGQARTSAGGGPESVATTGYAADSAETFPPASKSVSNDNSHTESKASEEIALDGADKTTEPVLKVTQAEPAPALLKVAVADPVFSGAALLDPNSSGQKLEQTQHVPEITVNKPEQAQQETGDEQTITIENNPAADPKDANPTENDAVTSARAALLAAQTNEAYAESHLAAVRVEAHALSEAVIDSHESLLAAQVALADVEAKIQASSVFDPETGEFTVPTEFDDELLEKLNGVLTAHETKRNNSRELKNIGPIIRTAEEELGTKRAATVQAENDLNELLKQR